ncbi:hypothetical protein L228DRAFT_251591 [Xylona heveae TC161]|uniref:K Homology domain-containing protein n=1 Tax=Xylona heveae (strain CBS 132557 / TC161) TaxID=1328760 RepID=A0A164ZFF0_XYLHT|nr:hypothetical protein L228DRAFT_251591 [Xylona heveae TC161]KZF19034.1 hypothetical protein L228DRAFT_251591 [Xylona heveae TC161]
MSLGSQFCRRSSSLRYIAENYIQAPGDRDPLLFLYPRWFSAPPSFANQKALPVHRARRRFYSIGRQAFAPQPDSNQEDIIHDVGSTKHQRIEQRAALDHGSVPQQPQSKHKPLSGVSSDTPGWSFSHSAENGKVINPVTAVERGVESEAGLRNLGALHSADPVSAKETRSGDGIVDAAFEKNGERTSKQIRVIDPSQNRIEKPTLDPKNKQRVEKAAKGAAKHKDNKSIINKHMKYKSPLSVDWRVPLTELEKNSPISSVGGSASVKQMYIPTDRMARLQGDLDGKLLAVKLRTGCHVTFSNLLGNSPLRRETITLKGTAESIKSAQEDISEIFGLVNDDGGEMDQLQAQKADRIRGVVERPVRADAFPRPQAWTTATFARYVDQLTTYSIPRTLHRQLYHQSEEHSQEVARIIKELFKDPANGPFISTEALNSALRFLYKQGMIPAARMLFIRVEMLKLGLTTETFNIMMRGAAAAGDLHNFTFLLRLMIQRGIIPNGATWVALLHAVDSTEVKLHIARRMKAKGLLHERTVLRAVVSEVMPNALRMFMDDPAATTMPPDAVQFLGKIDSIFPRQWPSTSAANKMLNELGTRGLIDQACKAIGWFRKRGVSPDTVSLNTLLLHCQRHRNETAAVKLLTMFTTQYHVVPDKITYDLLFKIAWRSQLYNVCRVVWRYACCYGHVSYFSMQRLVLQSLIRESKNEPSTESPTVREIWLQSAGKVIAGVNPESNGIGVVKRRSDSSGDIQPVTTLPSASSPPSSSSPSSAFPPSEPASYAPPKVQPQPSSQSDSVPTDQYMTTQPPSRSTAPYYALIGADLEAVARFIPSRSLAHILEEALERDRAWSRDGSWDSRDLGWKMTNAVDIPVVDQQAAASSISEKLDSPAINSP